MLIVLEARSDIGIRKRIEQYLERTIGDSTSIWQEVEDSFVSNVVGGREQSGHKL